MHLQSSEFVICLYFCDTLHLYKNVIITSVMFFDLVYTNHSGFYTAKNLLPITKNTKNQ